ncbi:ABC transporter permease subunit [Candidatus Gracilibacteria bacterium]|nr:ABC transporter permease subunit [Candidatus Gracilibacteria bacterium]
MFNIALNTFREILRNKFISLIVFLGVLLFLSSLIFDTLSLGQTERVLVDFGLSFIEITGLLVILLLGGGILTREIEGRTIYLLLSKPISRGSIIYGKFLGSAGVLLLLVVLECLFVTGILSMNGFFPELLFFLAVLGIYIKLLAILSLILFFSTCIAPTLALFMTLAGYIIGHSGFIMLQYAQESLDIIFLTLARFILALFPNLLSLNLKNYVATDAPIVIQAYLISFGMVFLYSLIITFLAAKIFERRSFDAV